MKGYGMAHTPGDLPITVDEPDPNIDWTIQSGTVMPSPYRTDKPNTVAHSVLPSAAQLATIGIDISTTAKRDYYFRFVSFSD